MAKEIHKDRILSHMSEAEEKHAKAGHGGGFSGAKSKRTKRRQELLAEQERHAMDKPKKLETQTDGDLSEVKKDPVWKSWLKQKDAMTGKQSPTGKPSNTNMTGGEQSHGKQSKQVREEGDGYKHGDPRHSQSLMPSDQGYNTQRGVELKHPEKFRTSHLPMDKPLGKKPKGERKISDLKEGGTGKLETIYTEPDRRYQADWAEDPSKRGEKDTTEYDDGRSAGTPKDEMTRTETKIHNKIPKTDKSPEYYKYDKRGRKRRISHGTDEQEEAKKKSWEVWLEKKERKFKEHKCTACGETRPEEHFTNPLGRTRGVCDSCNSAFFDPSDPEDAKIISFMDQIEHEDDVDEKGDPKTTRKAYVTKPIPDSKGGRGSFQHCINANQDKRNPGGWCKQIERKIGKAKKVPNKEVKLPQTKIDEPKHHWDHSKVGRNTGWEDDPMNKPSYFQAKMEEERKKKREAKEKGRPKHPFPCPTCGQHIGGGTLVRMLKPKEDKPESKEKGRTSRDRKRRQQEHVEAETSNLKDKTAPKDITPKDKPVKGSLDPLISNYGFGIDPKIGWLARKLGKKPPRGWVEDGKGADIATRYEDTKEIDRKSQTHVGQEESDKKLKADYFVEEIKSNIIYHNKILPLVGMIAGQASRGMGKVGKKIGGELLEGASEVGQGMLQGVAEEEEEQ